MLNKMSLKTRVLFGLIAVIASVTPRAIAENYVQVTESLAIDTDSIKRDGNLVTYLSKDQQPWVDYSLTLQKQANCETRQLRAIQYWSLSKQEWIAETGPIAEWSEPDNANLKPHIDFVCK